MTSDVMARITAATQVAGVVGDPVRHSLSPVLHNEAYRSLGLDIAYVAFPVPAGAMDGVVAAMRPLGLLGLSVTMPHKDDAARLADERSDDVARLGAANTLTRLPNGNIRADTTDGIGAIRALSEAGFDPAARRCMVLGAGGAGRAMVLALFRAGASEVLVVNRDSARRDAAVQLAGTRGRTATADEADGCDLILNATSLGMGDDDGIGVEPSRLGPGQFVHDLVYHPLETPLLAAARVRGATPVDGLAMLVGQAVEQIRIWTGEQGPADRMRAAAIAELAR